MLPDSQPALFGARHAALLGELHGTAAREHVTLAAGEGAYLYVLGPALSAFARDPSVELQLLTLGARATIEALGTGRADLGVAVLDLVPRGIEAHPIVTTPLCIALPVRHPAARLRGVTLEALRGARWILPPVGQLHRDLVTRAIGRSGDAPAGVIEADGWPLTLQFVALGLGVAIVNGSCHVPRRVVIRPLRELGSVTYRLLQRRGAALSPHAVALATALAGCIKT